MTDLTRPGIDGRRFCRLLRLPDHPAFNHVPLIVVYPTLNGDHPDRITADVGADAFLPSPVMLIADAPDVTIRMANPAALSIRGRSDEPSTGIPLESHPRRIEQFKTPPLGKCVRGDRNRSMSQ